MLFKNKKYNKLIEEARLLFRQEKLNEALHVYEEAFKIKTILKDFIMYGCILIDLNQLPKAEKIFKELSENYDFYEIHYSLGIIYEKTNRKHDALIEYEKAVHNDPNFELAHFALAFIYDELSEDKKEGFDGENTKKAIEHYKDVLRIDQNNFWANINIGSIYERNNHNEEALTYFQKAYEIDNQKEMVCYNLGVAYYKLKQYNESLKYYLEELEKESSFVSTYYNLGILYKDGFKDYERAKYCYLKALEKNKEDYNVWYNLGCIHSLEDNYKEAFECFKYIYYKNKKYLGYLDTDKELDDFRKTEYYDLLKNGL